RALADELGADYLRLQGRGGEGDSFFSTPSAGTHVEVRPARVDLDAYDLVLLGTPIWYWRPTALLLSFLRNTGSGLAGKQVVLFYTHQGGVSERAIRSWADRVGQAGARVIDVVGLDRRQLATARALEDRARALGRRHRRPPPAR